MIKIKHNRLIYKFFHWYARWKVDGHFRKVEIHTGLKLRGQPILLLANHMSWWDGFYMAWLNHHFFKKEFRVMMLEAEIRKRPFLPYTGAFSIKKKDRSVITSLNYAVELLEDPANLVILFPQGRIQSQHEVSVIFEKGIDRVLKKAPKQTQVVFSAAFIDYLSEEKPLLRIFLEEPTRDTLGDPGTCEAAYESFFQSARSRVLELGGTEA